MSFPEKSQVKYLKLRYSINEKKAPLVTQSQNIANQPAKKKYSQIHQMNELKVLLNLLLRI